MHHTEKGDRKVKPERDIQAVLQKEEDFQRLETLAIADAVAEEVKEKEAQDERETSSAVNLELCSTSEMMEVSSEYYEGMEPVHVNQLDPRRGAPKRQICPHFNIVVSHGYIRTHVCYEDGFFRYAKKQKTPPAQQASQQGIEATSTEASSSAQRSHSCSQLDLAGDTGYPTYTHPDSTKQQLVQDFWNMTCDTPAQVKMSNNKGHGGYLRKITGKYINGAVRLMGYLQPTVYG
ncbi:hypothetical protein WJX77_011054 [Trebouxia sp. C0004]